MKKQGKLFKLRNKLVFFYVPVFIIPIAILGLYLTIALSRSSIDQSIQISRQATQQLQQNILNELNDFYSIGFDTSRDSNIVQYLGSDSGSDVALYSFYAERIEALISKAQYRRPNLQAHIYTPNQYLKFSGIFIRDPETFRKMSGIAAAYASTACWTGVSKERVWNGKITSEIEYLSFLMPIINYKYSLDPIGVLEIKADISGLKQFFTAQSTQGNLILLMDDADRTILSNAVVDDQLLRIAKESTEDDENYVTYGGKRYLVTISAIDDSQIGINHWILCNLIPLDYVYRNRDSIIQASVIVCAGCLLVVIPLLYLFARTITKRLEYLTDRMDDIRHGEYNITISVSGNDEVTALGNCFNQMIQELDLLKKQAMEAELEEETLRAAQKDAQLLALQRQINPHYLFNTLESLRMSLVLKGDMETADRISIFAESFREMIDSGDRTVAISDELSFVKKYFSIQEFRYGGKIHLLVNVAPRLPDYRIPKFLLQPLIENAVYHGLELKEGDGTIRIFLYSREGRLCIAVSDDGVGMDQDDLERLRRSIDGEDDGRNFALRNIVKRLRLLYKDASDFRILSTPGKGTRVFVTLPISQLEGSPDVFCNGD